MLTREEYAAALAVIAFLAERYPKCFHVYEVRRQPLKIGIHLDILAKLTDAITPDALSIALGLYVKNKSYLRHMRAGAERIDLDGQPAGVVSEEDAHGADSILRKRLERLANKLQQQQIERKQQEIAAQPKRIRLKDLKRIALERKQRSAAA